MYLWLNYPDLFLRPLRSQVCHLVVFFDFQTIVTVYTMKSALRMPIVFCKDGDICYVLPVLSMSWLQDADVAP